MLCAKFQDHHTSGLAPIFLSYIHVYCLVVKVWCKFERNQTKATVQNLKMLLESLTG